MDKTVGPRAFLGMREVPLFLLPNSLFSRARGSPHQQPGGFSFAECETVLPLLPSSTSAGGLMNLAL